MNKIVLVASMGKNNEIGINAKNIFPVKSPLFMEKTKDGNIVMDQATYTELPNKILCNRKLVLFSEEEFDNDYAIIKHFNNLYRLLDYLKSTNLDAYITGKKEIYERLITYADKLLITKYNTEFTNATDYFPKINDNVWSETVLEEFEENDSKVLYRHLEYQRK